MVGENKTLSPASTIKLLAAETLHLVITIKNSNIIRLYINDEQ